MRKRDQADERTCFQEASPYAPQTDSRADVAVVYGLDPSFEERLARWRQAGYRIHVMTGVAWGSYQDYVRGEWDGQPHYDDAQAAEGGFKLEHGISQGHDCFYMMPSRTYARYLGEKLRRVVDAGALAIHLEEPEFWVRAGYGEGFQREWAEFYGEPWQDPASSPDARYRAEKLKQHLYTRTLATLFAGLKQYAAEKGNPDFKCYVPTHSLVNYAHWRIVSPESRLLAIPDCDGLIGQVWTGTSRTPTVYCGVRRQRTFEAGYCEYAACAAIVRGTDKRLWQLADPIEDDPNYCWDDYRVNWECTVTASLLVSDSERFEIMPWPRRIFMRSYPTVNLKTLPLAPLLQAYLKRLQEEEKETLYNNTVRAIDLFFEFYRQHGEASRRETPGLADPSGGASGKSLADHTPELRFGDVWGEIEGFYRHLATWEDQADAQRLRDAVSRFYHNPTDQRAFIPAEYAAELQIVFQALADMHWPQDTEWLYGQTGVGLGISDTLMYQRGEPQPSDPDMSSLYGLALPLVKHGTALTMVQLDRLTDKSASHSELACHSERSEESPSLLNETLRWRPSVAAQGDYLGNVRVLLLTYEGQKPPSAQVHAALAEWVKQGHALILFGAGDAYDTVREWWNLPPSVPPVKRGGYARPQEHLAELLGLGRQPRPGEYACGNGWVIVDPASPAALAHDPEGYAHVLAQVKAACGRLGMGWTESNALALRRGPYIAAAGMDESVGDEPVRLPGTFVNLFDARLSIHADPVIRPDTRWLLYDLSHCPDHPWVIAAAGRVVDERYDDHSLSFTVEGMADTPCAVRARLPTRPADVQVAGAAVSCGWDERSKTALLQFANDPAGVPVQVRW